MGNASHQPGDRTRCVPRLQLSTRVPATIEKNDRTLPGLNHLISSPPRLPHADVALSPHPLPAPHLLHLAAPPSGATAIASFPLLPSTDSPPPEHADGALAMLARLLLLLLAVAVTPFASAMVLRRSRTWRRSEGRDVY